VRHITKEPATAAAAAAAGGGGGGGEGSQPRDTKGHKISLLVFRFFCCQKSFMHGFLYYKKAQRPTALTPFHHKGRSQREKNSTTWNVPLLCYVPQ